MEHLSGGSAGPSDLYGIVDQINAHLAILDLDGIGVVSNHYLIEHRHNNRPRDAGFNPDSNRVRERDSLPKHLALLPQVTGFPARAR